MSPLRPRSAAWRRTRDFYRIREGYWFAPKRYGLGATPVRWQAWASIAVLMAAASGVTWLGRHHSPIYLALLAPLVLGFIALAHAKTDGGWKWRWGSREAK